MLLYNKQEHSNGHPHLVSMTSRSACADKNYAEKPMDLNFYLYKVPNGKEPFHSIKTSITLFILLRNPPIIPREHYSQ